MQAEFSLRHPVFWKMLVQSPGINRDQILKTNGEEREETPLFTYRRRKKGVRPVQNGQTISESPCSRGLSS